MRRVSSLTLPTDPVLLRNNLGSDVEIGASNTSEVSNDVRSSMSIKEAVRIAQENNFMGLVCNLRLLVSRGWVRRVWSNLTLCIEISTSIDRDHQGCRTRSCRRYLWAAFTVARCTEQDGWDRRSCKVGWYFAF